MSKTLNRRHSGRLPEEDGGEHLTEEDKRQIEVMGGFDKLLEEFMKLAEQTEAHHGGSNGSAPAALRPGPTATIAKVAQEIRAAGQCSQVLPLRRVHNRALSSQQKAAPETAHAGAATFTAPPGGSWASARITNRCRGRYPHYDETLGGYKTGLARK